MFLHLQKMQKRLIHINFFLTIAVLFTILFQSIHSFEHLSELFLEKEFVQSQNYRLEITDQSHESHHCFVCDFQISSFIAIDFFQFDFKNALINSAYIFTKSRTISTFYKGSLFLLRAPPKF